MVHPRAEADHFQRLLRRHRVPRDAGDERDILAGGEAGDEIVELEDEADAVPAEERERFFLRAVERPALVNEVPGGGHVEAAEDVEQGGFPAAGRAEQADKFTGVELDIHAVQRDHIELAGVIDLPHAAGLEDDPGGNRRRGEVGIHRAGGA